MVFIRLSIVFRNKASLLPAQKERNPEILYEMPGLEDEVSYGGHFSAS